MDYVQSPQRSKNLCRLPKVCSRVVKRKRTCWPFCLHGYKLKHFLENLSQNQYRGDLLSTSVQCRLYLSKHAFGYTYPSRERRNIVRNRNDNLSGYYCTKRQRDAYTMLKDISSFSGGVCISKSMFAYPTKRTSKSRTIQIKAPGRKAMTFLKRVYIL